MDAHPTCRHCGEPRIEAARALDAGRGTTNVLRGLGAVVGAGVALLTIATALERWPGATGPAEVARLVSIALPLGLALLGPATLGVLGWLGRLVATGRAPLGAPLRATPAAGLADGDRVTVRGRVKVRRAPLEGRPHIAAAARGVHVASGAFSIVLDDGSEVVVDDTDVVLGSRRPLDWLKDSVELADGDEVVACGPLRILAGGNAGYREADRTLAFDGSTATPVRLLKLAASTESRRATAGDGQASEGSSVPRVRVLAPAAVDPAEAVAFDDVPDERRQVQRSARRAG